MKIKIIFLLTTIFVLLTGCDKFLTNEPLGQYTQKEMDALNNQVNNTGGVNMVVYNNLDQELLAAYAVLTWDEAERSNLTHNGAWMMGDFLSDDAVKGGDGPSDLSEFNYWRTWTVPVSGAHSQSCYFNPYFGITYANNAINDIIKNKSTIGNIRYYKLLLGQALFLRTWFYFNLRGFGNVPDRDPGTPVAPLPAKMLIVDALYARCDSEFRTAISMLPLKSDFKLTFGIKSGGRATKGAAEAALCKCIMMEIGLGLNGYSDNQTSWHQVDTFAEDIINSGQYGLLPNYAMVWSNDGEFSPEMVFETNSCDCGQGYGHGGGNEEVILTSVRSTAGPGDAVKHIGMGWGFDAPTQDLFSAFEANDPRMPNTILKDGDDVYDDGNPSDVSTIAMTKNKDCPTGYNLRKYELYNA